MENGNEASFVEELGKAVAHPGVMTTWTKSIWQRLLRDSELTASLDAVAHHVAYPLDIDEENIIDTHLRWNALRDAAFWDDRNYPLHANGQGALIVQLFLSSGTTDLPQSLEEDTMRLGPLLYLWAPHMLKSKTETYLNDMRDFVATLPQFQVRFFRKRLTISSDGNNWFRAGCQQQFGLRPIAHDLYRIQRGRHAQTRIAETSGLGKRIPSKGTVLNVVSYSMQHI